MALKIRLNLRGFNEFRNSAGVVALLQEKGDAIVENAASNSRSHIDESAPFAHRTVHNRSRAVTFVSTANIDGMLAEVEDRTLTKAAAVYTA